VNRSGGELAGAASGVAPSPALPEDRGDAQQRIGRSAHLGPIRRAVARAAGRLK
jgi:hypothetical protein